MLVSVVIVNYNRYTDLREALWSAKKQDHPEVEIIVVDNASTDGSQDMLTREFPDVTFIALNENTGMDGYSIGFKETKGEIVFQMDNDSLMPDRDVLSNVVRRFKEGPSKLAVVATRVEEFNPMGDEIRALRERDTRHGPLDTGGFHSGGVAFKKSSLDQVGYYNRDVFLYASESFLQMNFLAAGYKIMYYPEILMLHKSSHMARSSRSIYFKVRNRYWFLRHFGSYRQTIRILPKLLFHDLLYAIGKRAFTVVLLGMYDGLKPLPISLRKPIRSSQKDFEKKLEEFGRSFSLSQLVKFVFNKREHD